MKGDDVLPVENVRRKAKGPVLDLRRLCCASGGIGVDEGQ